MRRLQPRHLFSAALLALGGLVLSAGCADNNSMLFVRGVVSADASSCTPKADPANTYLAYGYLDTAFTSTYTGFLLVGNQLVARGSRTQIRTEPNRITIRGAVVTISNPAATGAAFSFSTTATGFVDPSLGDTPGYGLVAVDLIPGVNNVTVGGQPYLPTNGEVIVTVSVFGDTLGGTSITSSSLTFPIKICYGCLVSFPSKALDPLIKTRCTGDPPTTTPCTFGQDAAVDCRLCVGNPACVPPASAF